LKADLHLNINDVVFLDLNGVDVWMLKVSDYIKILKKISPQKALSFFEIK
jgi:hypothetical protein